MRFLTISLMYFLCFSNLIAQDTWVNGWGSSFNTIANQVAIDPAGNVYTIGRMYNDTDFDPGPDEFILSPTSLGTRTMYIQKVDADGNFLWAKHFPDTSPNNLIRQIQYNADGIDIIGSFEGSIDLDPSDEVFTVSANGAGDNFLLRLNEDGDFQWAKVFGEMQTQSNERYGELGHDEAGNIIIAFVTTNGAHYGGASGTVFTGNRDAIILKINKSNGNLIASEQIDGNSSTTFNYDSLDDLQLFVEGNRIFITVIGVTSVNGRTVYVIELDNALNISWIKSFGLTSTNGLIDSDGLRSHLTVHDNRLYISGRFSGTVDFDPHPNNQHSLTSEFSYNTYILALSDLGVFQWVRQFGLTDLSSSDDLLVRSMDVTPNGDLLIGGFYEGEADLDPTDNAHILESDDADLFLIRLNEDGELVWIEAPNDSSDEYVEHLIIDDNHYLHLLLNGGTFSSNNPFMTIEGEEINAESYVINLIKKKLCFQQLGLITIDDTCEDVDVNGTIYNQEGVFYQELESFFGCDSLLTIEINYPELDLTIVADDENLISNQEGVNYQWFDCNTNEIIENATQAVFTPTENGNYAVELLINGCAATTECFEFVLNATSQLDLEEQVDIYPTLFENKLIIDFSNIEYQSGKFYLTNLQGENVFISVLNTNGNHEFSLPNDLPSGIYFAKILVADEILTKKVIKY